MIKTAVRLGEIQAGYNLPIDPEEYARGALKFGLVEVVYEWAKVCEAFCYDTVFINVISSIQTKYKSAMTD